MGTETLKISAYHISENISLKQFKADFTGDLLYSSSSELFYSVGEGGFLYLFNYGVAAFAGMSDVESTRVLSLIKEYSQNIIDEDFFDDYILKSGDVSRPAYGFDEITVSEITPDVIKIVMLNLAQSVALDYYSKAADVLLESVNRFADKLEKTGRMGISKKNMLKFVGKTLNSKNRIIDNLYIFDVPDIVWDSKYLDEIHTGLIRVFDLKSRFKEVQASFKNIEENLSIFIEVHQHKMSNILEWIIIVLILIEVVDLFITKIF